MSELSTGAQQAMGVPRIAFQAVGTVDWPVCAICRDRHGPPDCQPVGVQTDPIQRP